MNYLSLCSGIEAATQAWHPLGWTPVAFSEIEKFPSAVLAHHYPDVPNWGDMTKFKEWPDADVDVLVGGTPCQSFSVAGLRKGLDDPRGNLALTYCAIAERYRPRWLVWENVPGVLSSSGGRDFGSFLGALGQLGYGFAYRVLDAQYVRTRRYARAVPQRRRRVFVVGHLGDWRRAAAVLFDPESLSGNPPPRREAGQVASTIPSRSTAGGGLGTDFDCDGGTVAQGWGIDGEINATCDSDAIGALTEAAGSNGRPLPAIAHTLRAEHDASEDGTGRGTPIVPFEVCGALSDGAHMGGGLNGQDAYTGRVLPVAFAQNSRNEVRKLGGDGQIAGALAAEPGMKQTTYIAFHNRQDPDISGDVTHPLGRADNGMAIAFKAGQGEKAGGPGIGNVSPTLSSADSGTNRTPAMQQGMAVRRLTCEECEALQGFPRGFTRIPWRGKDAENCPDGPRYKALGNSMAVNVMDWIGQRIALVEGLE